MPDVGGQAELPLFNDEPASTPETHPATWSPREVWLRLSPHNLDSFKEDRRLERKSANRLHFATLAEYMSMWSNTPEGGIIVIGQEDRGALTGCADLSQDQLNRLDNFHSQMCPLAEPDSRRIPVIIDRDPNFVIAIYVPYQGVLVETTKGEAFIRRGDSKHKMSPEEMDDFRSTRQERSWEQREAGQFTFPDDFDRELIDDFCESFRAREGKPEWTDWEILRDRFLLVEREGGFYPTNALVLFAANQPRKSSPGARVRVLRFRGSEEGQGETFDPIRNFYIEGPIPRIIEKAQTEVANLVYDVTWLRKDGKFVTTQEYPYWAWFEAIVNALVHRSYTFSGSEVSIKFFDDHLEIESPGGFVPPVNAKNVYETRASRNPHLMEALRYLGFVQMNREGTRRMRDDMERLGLPAPLFTQEEENGVSIRVTLRNDHETRKRATDKQVASFVGVQTWKTLADHEIVILDHAYNNEQVTVNEVAKITNKVWRTAKKDLERLKRRGLLTFHSAFSRDPKAHYRINRDWKADDKK